MRFSDFKLLSAVPVPMFLLIVFTVGCSSSFSKRIAYSVDSMKQALTQSDIWVSEFWMQERTLHLLQTERLAIKTNGIISYAIFVPERKSTVSGAVYADFQVCFLSADANIRKIIVMDGDDVIMDELPIHRKWWKMYEREYVHFYEKGGWRTENCPFQGHRIEDLTVKLVKDDGRVIGPVRILSAQDVWDDVCAKMGSDQEWQDRFPWLHARLQEDPSMKPLWRNPDQMPKGIMPPDTAHETHD